MAVSPARWAAYRILRQVESQAAQAGEFIHSAFTAPLDERDAALAEELVLGVLRRREELDQAILEAAGPRSGKLDPEVRLALRLGIYQLHRLDRVPPHAAVSESVEIVKRARKASAAGLVNAILRKLAVRPAPRAASPELAVPAWLLDRWRRNFGDQAEPLALATLERHPAYLRLNARFEAEETVDRLAAQGVRCDPTELPLCRRVTAGNPAGTECFREGRVRIQDLGSQRVLSLLDLVPGQRFLDLCAAPGGKTFQALEQVVGAGPAVACDVSHRRLLAMRSLATLPVALVVLDATRPLPFRGPFDRILVDAPCSGTGTLARNPDIKWRLQPADLELLAARQRAILSQALQLLAPGGRLVYSTCSLEPEENQGVVEAVVPPPFAIADQRLWLPIQAHGGAGIPSRARSKRCCAETEEPLLAVAAPLICRAAPGDGFFACVIVLE